MTFWQGLLALALIFGCGLLILVVLLQRGRGEGLTGAFGGAGGGGAFGAKTGDVFTLITVVVAVFVLGLSVAANYVFDDTPAPRRAAVSTTEEVKGSVPVSGAVDSTNFVPVESVELEPPDVPSGFEGLPLPKAQSDSGADDAAGTESTGSAKEGGQSRTEGDGAQEDGVNEDETGTSGGNEADQGGSDDRGGQSP